MHDNPSPLLAQVPLTVSPFINLPKPPTLPHNYATLPSTLPPSVLSAPPAASSVNSTSADHASLPAYVTSSTSSFTAHPSSIIAQNQSLLQGLTGGASAATKKVQEWEKAIADRELGEKRRKAPGWLDSEDKILQPAQRPGTDLMDGDVPADDKGPTSLQAAHPGQASRGAGDGQELGDLLDQAFGGLG